jgi:hypothetical protein
VTYADNTRHYGFYIDGDIAKLPGGGRKGAAVLCELLPDQLAQGIVRSKHTTLLCLNNSYKGILVLREIISP